MLYCVFPVRTDMSSRTSPINGGSMYQLAPMPIPKNIKLMIQPINVETKIKGKNVANNKKQEIIPIRRLFLMRLANIVHRGTDINAPNNIAPKRKVTADASSCKIYVVT